MNINSSSSTEQSAPVKPGVLLLSLLLASGTAVASDAADSDAMTYKVNFRTYYLDRNQFDDGESQAWAAGGWVGMKTGYLGGRAAFGGTVYGSYPVDAPDDKDGTGLLAPDQKDYTVLGELYADIKLTDNIYANLGRKEYDTPYINRNDTRMTPNTFQAYTFRGESSADASSKWRFLAGYFDEIKTRTSEDFLPMSEVAGADVDEGVYVGGIGYENGAFAIDAYEYYSPDIINTFYTEARYSTDLSGATNLHLAAQFTDQQSTGDDLLMGDFNTGQLGVKAAIGVGAAKFTAAYTTTDDGANIQNQWGSHPGYTFAEVEAFNRAGEDAFLLRADYQFKSVPGLIAYALWIDGSDPEGAMQYAHEEYDLNVQWKATSGSLKGLTFRFRYANVNQDDPASSDLDEFRIIVNYTPPGL